MKVAEPVYPPNMRRVAFACTASAMVATTASAQTRAGAPTLDLSGSWAQEPGWTKLTVLSSSASQVSVSYEKGKSYYCGCGGVRLRVPLERTFTCKDTTLSFDFQDARAPGAPSSRGTSVSVTAVFCKGDECGSVRTTNGQYADNAIVATDGRDAATMCWKSDRAALRSGRVELAVADGDPTREGACTSDFDAIQLYIQAASCSPAETGTITIGNLRVTNTPAAPASNAPLTPQESPVADPEPPPQPSNDQSHNATTSAGGSWSIVPSLHAALGLGGAVGGDSGFRASLDIGGGVGFYRDNAPWLLGASLITGFGAYPTYVSVDFGKAVFAGKGQWGALAGGMFTIGPALRVHPGVYPGAELSVRAYILLFQVGARFIYAATPSADAQIEGTLGVGFL